MRLLKTDAATVLVAALAVLLFTEPLAAQTGTVTGTVRNADTGAPVFAANVDIVGTGIRSFTQADGRFSLLRVPAGDQQVRVRVMGFAPLTQDVVVRAGEVTEVDLDLRPEAVALAEVVVTGTVGAVERAKLPFTVDQLRAEDMPVTQVNMATALRGKVAGAQVVQGSGRPGAAPSVLLRGATSLDASGRSQEPLYIVDGVILGASVVDVDALDIQSIEIVKGAAAASMYGSRAANGAVVITTQRGQEMADGQVRYTARATLGTSDIEGEFPLMQNTFWALGDDGNFVDTAGNTCYFRGSPSWQRNVQFDADGNPQNECPGEMPLAGQRAGEFGGDSPSQWNTFATNPWPDGTFDHVDRFFDGGGFQEYYVAASGRQGRTNFHVSFNRMNDVGPVLGQDGFRRSNFRLNLDQVVRPNLQVSASAFYSRSDQQGFPEGSGNPIFDITRMQGGVDLTACEPMEVEPGVWSARAGDSCLDEPENLLLNVNPTNVESPNPLYEVQVRDNNQFRGRFLGSANLRYTPISWLDLDADISYDRLDREWRDVRPKGFRTIAPSPSLNDGTLWSNNLIQEALNASVTASVRYDIGDNIVSRTRVRYLYEQQDIFSNTTSGQRFGAEGVPTLGNLNRDFLSAGSSSQEIIADGFFLITNFDIADRYIIDGLLRNDGSSLFGEDERRQWYGRIAGAWRIAQEPWFDVPQIDELKARASFGTAGSRPNFAAQFETFSVAAGTIVPVNLGNRALRPEQAREIEVGLDASFFNRLDVAATYANTETEDQIMRVPLPSFMGFSQQWQNVGTVESQTWELSVGALLVSTPDFSWTARVLYDQTRSTITELNRPDFRFGVGGQAMSNVFLAREGETVGTFYGPTPAQSCADLPEGLDCGEFTTDENGYLVWVGGGSLADNAWGTGSGYASAIGAPIMWGTPFAGECTDPIDGERTNFCKVGNTFPDHTWSLSSTVNWRGLSVYGLFEAVRGFDVWNQPLSWSVFRDNAGLFDSEDKPIGYWRALYGGLGGLTPNGEFVEDASFVKFRELSVRYGLTADQLAGVPGLSGFSGLTLSVSGRNLHTWTDYRNYDPEVGRSGGDVGSAAIARVDGFNYPNFRTFTFGIELNF